MKDFDFYRWYRERIYHPCSERTLKRITDKEIKGYRKYIDSAEQRKESIRGLYPEAVAQRKCDRIDQKVMYYMADAEYLSKHKDFKTRLITNYGYIDEKMLLEAKEVLGENHYVIVHRGKEHEALRLKDVVFQDQKERVFLSHAAFERLYNEWQMHDEETYVGKEKTEWQDKVVRSFYLGKER